jgi:hypothetical protein
VNNAAHRLWMGCALPPMDPHPLVPGVLGPAGSGENVENRPGRSAVRSTAARLLPCGLGAVFPVVPSPYSYNL